MKVVEHTDFMGILLCMCVSCFLFSVKDVEELFENRSFPEQESYLEYPLYPAGHYS